MKVWLVEADDLTAIWDSYEKAIDYVMGEKERCGWELMQANKESDVWTEFLFSYDGKPFAVNVLQYEVNEKPYI